MLEKLLGFAFRGLIPAICAYLLLYIPLRFVYRLYFHPLAKVPGPKLRLISDSATRLHSIITGAYGRSVFDLRVMHEQYGPIVRIFSNEVHLNDIDTYNQIYKVGTKFPKTAFYYTYPAAQYSTFALLDFKAAQIRRSAILPYFSKQAVRKVEWILQEKIDLFLNRVSEMDTINLSRGFRCLICDIITTYSYEKCYEALRDPNFSPSWLLAFEELVGANRVCFTFPKVFEFMSWVFETLLPRPTVKKLSPEMGSMMEFQDTCSKAVLDQQKRWLAGERNITTIFEQLFQDDPKKGRKAATKDELEDEAFLVIAAGMDTSAHALTVAVYYLVKYPDIQAKLLEDLKTVLPNPRSEVKEETLEQLPFLQAVIKETFRFSHGVVNPMARDVPAGGANILGYHLPQATVTLNSHYIYHMNPEVFPEPFTWNPERWLAQDTKEVENYLMPFSRGARICVGLNLAWAELLLTLARLIRRYDISFTDDFTDDNMDWVTWFLPITQGMLTVTMKERTE
ncbi:hypothetical protein H072_7603 [Dactylellina haptotyla CBS 200.50]|uniref:Cytochrome P450 n=1 Tax=Dactylellina haptotyla (strain CBS 200.50) TaxID=1284197 RepID=S8BH80_DACHA|nr:hypothetical protein H072_7603 [Dactylellina haptotyla CBS 200.50]